MYDGPYKFQVTPHFWLYEFKVSCSRPDLAEKIRFNELDGIKAHYLATTILEPVRMHFGKPVIITSGKCSSELNSAIPGRSKTTEHTWEGSACVVDCFVKGVSSAKVHVWIRTKLSHSFGQLIYYPGKHIHVGLPTHKHQGEAWINGG